MQRLTLIILIYCITASFLVQADEGFPTYSVNKIQFQTPFTFSEPDSFGLDAFNLNYPVDASMGKTDFEIILIFFDTDMLQTMAMPDQDLVMYAKNVFLGTMKPAKETKTRNFMGTDITGEVLAKRIPQPSKLEMYLISLSDDSKVVISFVFPYETEADFAENIITVVAETFTELRE